MHLAFPQTGIDRKAVPGAESEGRLEDHLEPGLERKVVSFEQRCKGEQHLQHSESLACLRIQL